MALPNFRLFETQARWAMYLAFLSVIGLGAMTLVVFHGLSWDTMNIPYKPNSEGMGRYRQPLIFASAALVILVGLFATGLGYSSLGEKRNAKQSCSWMGMMLGSLCTTFAILWLVAWNTLQIKV